MAQYQLQTRLKQSYSAGVYFKSSLMVAFNERLEDHQRHYDSSPGESFHLKPREH